MTTTTTTNDGAITDERRSQSVFYRAIWRWHFYAGLFVVPLMIVLAVTGSIYLFKPQLDRLMYGDLMHVQHPSGSAQSYTSQLAAAQAAYPAASVGKIRPSDAHDRSTEISMSTSDGRNLTVFVNPYTNQVLGERDEDWNLQTIALKLHGELLIGTTGDRIIELAACWAILLTLSGLYLWWPRSKSGIWGTWLPRLRSKNKRIFWRDLHAVPGMYASLIVLFLLISGLPWTGYWGDKFANVWSGYPNQLWSNIPESTVLTGSLNTTTDKVVPWAVEQAPLPQSDPDHAEHRGDGASAPVPSSATEGPQAATPVTLDSVIEVAKARGVIASFTVTPPDGEKGVYTIAAVANDPADEATIHVDQYSGAILADIRWRDYAMVPKAVSMGISLHEGKYFGLANQLLALFGAMTVLLLSVSGVVLWWKRRPEGRLGAPNLPANFPHWKPVLLMVVLASLAFPLVGASLLFMLVLDLTVFRFAPSLKQRLA